MAITIPEVTLAGHTWRNVTVKFSHYMQDNSLAIVTYVTEDLWEEPLASASVLLVGQPPAEGCVWIKDYSENEGMLAALVEAGIVQPTGRTARSGFVDFPEVKVLVDPTEHLI